MPPTPANEVRVELEVPIEISGEVVRQLTFHRPKVRDLLVMDQAKGEVDGTRRLLAQLAGVPPSQLNELDAADFVRCSNALAPWLAPLAALVKKEDEEAGGPKGAAE